ncbi:ImmA/IrrE family metallo-endopeptidase [Candidatus Daviesbacteria bacterium]|nr:ImmA/IrrE family metallo-endopeptidase [Candidatus Daviesbacteria bacterium]
MGKDKIQQIELKTRDILEQVLGKIIDLKPPINLAKVLEYFDVSLSLARFKVPSVAGAFDKRLKMIYLSKDEPYKRQFFTAAHELGHLVLNHKKNFDVFYRQQLSEFNGLSAEARAKEGKASEEKEANYFAASLLMPEELVKKFWNEKKDIELLAAYFGVSRSAAYWRLKNLKVI